MEADVILQRNMSNEPGHSEIRRGTSIGPDRDVINETGMMDWNLPTPDVILRQDSRSNDINRQQKLWDLNYQEAAIYLQEGEDNVKFYAHPKDYSVLPIYQIANSTLFHMLNLMAAFLILVLAVCEEPAVDSLTLNIGIHASLELLGLLLLGLDLFMRLKWVGWISVFKHKRTCLKMLTLVVMLVEAVVVLVRQTSHFRVTRALRPLFLLDSHYLRGVRRFARQVMQSMPPILDMIVLLLFVMLIFSILGFYIFAPMKNNEYFSTIQDSFISLFVLLTTANFPDVMMPAYAVSKWSAAFFVTYLSIELYFLMNLLLAVVYDTFSRLEKRKLRQLFFHKRAGCQHAFKLLVGRYNPNCITAKHFQGLMKYYRSKKTGLEESSFSYASPIPSSAPPMLHPCWDQSIPPLSDSISMIPTAQFHTYLVFKSLNVSKTGSLTLDEFYNIYEAVSYKWKAKYDDTIWSSSFKYPFNRIFKALYIAVSSKSCEYFVYVVIAVNFIWIVYETIHLSVSGTNMTSYHFEDVWVPVLFVTFYGIEAILKILGKGPREYFTQGWDIFDFSVTIVSMVGVLGLLFDDSFYYIMVLRPFRLLRLFKIKQRFRDVLGTLILLRSRLTILAIFIMLLYYFFAIIGMELFGHQDLTNCCKNTSVEQFYHYDNTSRFEGNYYLNNFDDIILTFVTLFELTVVNNWFIIMEGYAYQVSQWTRIYFMLFYIVVMVVMNVVVAFVLDAFIFRIQYRRKMNLDDMEDQRKCRVDIGLSDDELSMCKSKIRFMSGHQIPTQTDADITNLYRGERSRNREDFSLLMYSDEVKIWLSEESNQISSDGSSPTFLSPLDRNVTHLTRMFSSEPPDRL